MNCVKEVNHPSEERSPRPHHLACVVEQADQGLQLLVGAGPAITPLSQEILKAFTWSFSCGSRSSPAIVSISTPRNIRQVVGPSLFWTFMGTPSIWQIRSRISRHSWHCGESGRAMMIDSVVPWVFLPGKGSTRARLPPR